MAELLLAGDHAEIDVLLDDALTKLEAEDPAAGFDALDLVWARLAVHIRAEHLHLFPAALKVSGREGMLDIPETVERRRRDHDVFMHELPASIKAIRTITPQTKTEIGREAARALRAIRDRLIEHNAIEEQRIYPLRSFLSEPDDKDLSRSVAKELDNLPPRFSK